MILAVVGPSGSGKTTLCNSVKDRLGLSEILSLTTRPMRKGESQGHPYRFVTEDVFDKIEKIESVVYSGNKYGIPKSEVEANVNNADKNSYIIVSIEGYEQLKKIYGEKNVKGIYIKVDENRLANRMEQRGSNNSQVTERMQHYFKTREWEAEGKVEYVFDNNGDLKDRAETFIEFIREILNADGQKM